MERIIRLPVYLFGIVLLLSGCETESTMTTRVKADGSMVRQIAWQTEVNKLSQSDSTQWPVRAEDGWVCKVVMPDGLKRPLDISQANAGQVKSKDKTADIKQTLLMEREFRSARELNEQGQFSSAHPLGNVRQEVVLDRQFRWFYTEYHFTQRFITPAVKFSVPVDKYFMADESGFWFMGVPNLTLGLPGREAAEVTNQLERKYINWLHDNFFEDSYQALLKAYQPTAGEISVEKLRQDKDSLRTLCMNETDEFSVDLRAALHKYYGTSSFDRLWEKDGVMKHYENSYAESKNFDLLEQKIHYRLIMPGRLTSTNAAMTMGDTLKWQVSGFGVMDRPIELQATSRRNHLWSYILTGLLGGAVIAMLLHRFRRHR